jgi:hypothetical protein
MSNAPQVLATGPLVFGVSLWAATTFDSTEQRFWMPSAPQGPTPDQIKNRRSPKPVPPDPGMLGAEVTGSDWPLY